MRPPRGSVHVSCQHPPGQTQCASLNNMRLLTALSTSVADRGTSPLSLECSSLTSSDPECERILRGPRQSTSVSLNTGTGPECHTMAQLHGPRRSIEMSLNTGTDTECDSPAGLPSKSQPPVLDTGVSPPVSGLCDVVPEALPDLLRHGIHAVRRRRPHVLLRLPMSAV